MVSADFFSKISVRNRIVVLAAIPVLGLLAIGAAFKTGDIEVGRAFDSVRRDSEVADASRDLKTGLLEMRTASTEFVSRPSDAEVKDFAA
jgi:methyl-accepting chemotaxis protein